jgi:uncharacterized membrane protein
MVMDHERMARIASGRRMASWGLILFWVGVGLGVAGVADTALGLGDAAAAADTWDAPPILYLGLALLAASLVFCGLGLVLRARGLRHAHATTATFLDDAEEGAVLAAIRAFENRTSGELVVHLCDRTREADILEAAKRTFERLGLTATRDRNAVLFFVAVGERRLAVLGDQGIHERVGPDFWHAVVGAVAPRFQEARFGAGLVAGIVAAGEALAAHFPPRPDDRNELPDAISGRVKGTGGD